jgi:flagellar basal body P-ring formation protein FlgA
MKAAIALIVAAFAVIALTAESGELRANIEARGPALTFGDVFVDAGAASAKPIAPAPAPGQTGDYSARFIAAAAAAEGIDWTPPQGLDAIRVARPIENARAASAAAFRQGAPGRVQAAIRANDAVTLTYQTGGVRLTLRGRAISAAGIGETVRVLNIQSNRTVDAIVDGPGAARVTATP